jgi:hypothetical protein
MILQNNSSISLFHKISSAIENVILLDFRCKFLSILGPVISKPKDRLSPFFICD